MGKEFNTEVPLSKIIRNANPKLDD